MVIGEMSLCHSQMQQGAALEDENEMLRTQLAALQDQIQTLAIQDQDACDVLAAAGGDEDTIAAAHCLLQLTDHAQLVSSAYQVAGKAPKKVSQTANPLCFRLC